MPGLVIFGRQVINQSFRSSGEFIIREPSILVCHIGIQGRSKYGLNFYKQLLNPLSFSSFCNNHSVLRGCGQKIHKLLKVEVAIKVPIEPLVICLESFTLL